MSKSEWSPEAPSANRHIESVWLGQAFLDEFILVYPVYAIMMLDAGLSAMELSILFAIWSLSALLFEIPSGVIGDLVNRRRYVVLGSLIRASGYLIWLAFPVMTGFAFGFLLWSLGSAIHSGTLQALLHDVLAEQQRPEAFARIYGRGKAMESVAVLSAMALGGYLAQENGYGEVLLLSALAPVLAAMLFLGYVSEPPRAGDETGSAGGSVRAEVGNTFLTALRAVLGSRVLTLTALMMVLFLGGSGVIDEYLGPLFAEPGVLSLGVIGMLYGGVLGARAVGALVAHRLRTLSLRNIGLLCASAHGLLFFGMQLPLPMLVAACAGYFALMGVVEVLLEANLQEEIQVSARATITSIAGAGLEVWGIALFLLIGAAAQQGSWVDAVGWVGLLVLGLSLALAYTAGPVAARMRS